MGNLPEALETLKQAHNADPESALVRYFLGDIMVRQGDLDEGIGHLQAARERLTNFYDVDVAYAYALRMQGDRYGTIEERDIYYAQAKAIFLQVAQERPRLQDISGESAFGALAGLYRREGNLREAIRWYERAREATPQNSYPINNLALCYFALGDAEKARQYFEQSLAMARSRQTLVPMDYYSRFDVITARLGLHCLDPQTDPYPDDLMHDDFHDTLELVNAMGISTRPLHTFRTGLERLDPASHPPVEAAIRLLDAEMAQMERP